MHTVRLEIARCPEFPEGSGDHGYTLRLPLDAGGRLDPAGWEDHCRDAVITRFWGGDSEGGRVTHDGHGWALVFEDDPEAAEPIFRSAEHRFVEGEYVSIIERDGATRTFRVVSVTPPQTVKPAMRAMVLRRPGEALAPATLPTPSPGPHQVLIQVHACAVCRTDLHIVDGDLPQHRSPLVPGHEIVGTILDTGSHVSRFRTGDRVGVPWLGWTCGQCAACHAGRENLCERAAFTGWHLDGGYAELTVADERFCFALPDSYSDIEAAPLLCAGLIGYRAFRLAGEARRLGLYGFGAAAHIIAQVARARGSDVFAFTRPGDTAAQSFALGLGAAWAGGSDEKPPAPLDAALIFAPVGALVPVALGALAPGGTVVCAGIHMSDIPSFPYELLWQERVLRSVANLTRRDGDEFLALARTVPIRTATTVFPLAAANEALDRLRSGQLEGAAVLVPGPL